MVCTTNYGTFYFSFDPTEKSTLFQLPKRIMIEIKMNEWIDQSNLQLNKTLHVHTYVYVQLYIFTYTYRYSYSENMFCVQHCIEKSLILLLLEHSATFWLCTHRWSLANSLHMFFAHDKDIFSRRKNICIMPVGKKVLKFE